jgi:hypothetical protein
MTDRERIELLRRHVAEAQAEQTAIQNKLANATLAPDAPQMMAWRIRLEHWERIERDYRARLERLLQDRD